MAKVRLNRIKIVLDEFYFSQKDLAEYLDVSRNTVTNWCRNYYQPSLEQLFEIAKLFHIDTRQLIEPVVWETGADEAPYHAILANKSMAKLEIKTAKAKSAKAVKKKR